MLQNTVTVSRCLETFFWKFKDTVYYLRRFVCRTSIFRSFYLLIWTIIYKHLIRRS